MSDKLNELENVVPETEAEEIIEETTETPEEITEEVIEEADETVEESVEEISEDMKEAVEETSDSFEKVVAEVNEEVSDILPENVEKKSSLKKTISIIVVIALVAAVLIGIIADMTGNKYNKMGYVPVSGLTVQDIADEMGVDIAEFLAMYDLPADMPKDTTQEAAFYNIPLAKFAEMNGLDVELLKTALNIPAETTVTEPKNIFEKIERIFKPVKPEPITETTPWGVVLDELTLGSYVGAEQLEEFKIYYELDESVSVDTLYKEVREQVDKKSMELLKEQKALEATESNENAEDLNTEEVSGTEEVTENADETETSEE